ncbi:hypothetical protein [Myxococcus xanthus]|uniref:hypothetical protein n=1 Tax=Myxococcus xanthus TaxID=34 RepID=UPI0020A52BA9|nr:hypothetical protein [Myxococcus xanthus]
MPREPEEHGPQPVKSIFVTEPQVPSAALCTQLRATASAADGFSQQTGMNGESQVDDVSA